MHRRGNEAAGLADLLAHLDVVALLDDGLGRRADVLRQRDDDPRRRRQLNNGITAVIGLAAYTLMRMNAAGKQMLSKHGQRSPFQCAALGQRT